MAATRAIPAYRRTVVLDADGLSKLARRDHRVRAMVRQEVEAGSAVVAPSVAVIQSLVEGIGRRALDAVLVGTLDRPLDRAREDLAARLMRASAATDVADGLVAAEALLSVPSIVITSDPRDIRRLLDADERAGRVAVWDV